MLHNNINDILPEDMMKSIFVETDRETFFNTYLVSQSWNGLFNSTNWKKRIEKDFKIKASILSQFAPELILADKQFFHKIYKKLYFLINQTNYSTLLSFKRILQDKSKHFLLIACCSDIPSHLLEVMFPEE